MEMNHLVTSTIDYVKQELADAEAGHDWWHVERVWKLAKEIALTENVNLLVVELGALLHDIADSKFHQGDETIGPEKAKQFLSQLGVAGHVTNHVIQIIQHISFKGGNGPQQFKSPELDVVQDADRLDAMGAIGIARAFHYGGYKNRTLYDPEIAPNLQMTKDAYKNSQAPTINHFYEKLLLLKDRMNTSTGKTMALHRHQFMETFLEAFYREWQGK